MATNIQAAQSIINKQRSSKQALLNFVLNLRKTGKANRTKGFLLARQQLLRDYWDKYFDYHGQLVELSATEKAVVELDYFVDEEFSQIETTYSEAYGYIEEELTSLSPGTTSEPGPSGLRQTTLERNRTSFLPNIKLPSFDGSYLNWPSFKDLFTSMVMDQQSLTNVQRLHYLKSSVSGEAAAILRDLTITDANFVAAWNLLLKHFENKRALVNVLFNRLMSISALQKESVEELKGLLFTTQQIITAFSNLERPVGHWDDWLVYLTVSKLDKFSRQMWESSLNDDDELPTFRDLENFLRKQIRVLESFCQTPSSNSKSSDQTKTHAKPSYSRHDQKLKSFTATNTVSSKQCQQCGRAHFLAFCSMFRHQPILQRRELANRENLCFNCLNADHVQSNCPSKFSCRICQRRHHSLLHLNESSTPSSSQVDTSIQTHHSSLSTHFAGQASSIHYVLLATAIVMATSSDGTRIPLRALLDQGSQCSFLTESAVQLLKLPKTKVSVTVNGIAAGKSIVSKAKVRLAFSSVQDLNTMFTVEPLVLSTIASHLPSSTLTVADWSHLKQLSLADPQFNRTGQIDILLGADIYGSLLTGGLRKGAAGQPIAQNTALGWVVSGPLGSTCNTVASLHVSTDVYAQLERQLRRFWEIETVTSESLLTEEEQLCENHYQLTHRRTDNGRYSVRLPITERTVELGDSRSAALSRLHSMERRFSRDPELRHRYQEFMQVYRDLGHMRPAPTEVISTLFHYLPHHSVLKEASTSTKLRVVFDASHKTSSGFSLNDKLLIGPKLQQDLQSVILRWRTHFIVMSADVEKMFRQIQVDEEDRDLQRILWRNRPTDAVQEFQLNTVTYGTACAPFLAIRTLRQLALDERNNYPDAADTVLHNCYVDDILSGANTVSSALQLQAQLINLFRSGGFELKKWTSNHPQLLDHLPADYCETSQLVAIDDSEEIVTALGLRWSPKYDLFSYDLTLKIDFSQPVTKRAILSIISKLFDPLGWISPVIIRGKILMQRIWIEGIPWDTIINNHAILELWRSYQSSLPDVAHIRIPRWLGTDETVVSLQLHGFSDASVDAYAAAVYLRLETTGSLTAVSTLVTAKTKVAPVKQQSLPRLELCGALLLARLMTKVCFSLRLKDPTVYGWTDSTVVLSWLADHPTRWKTFIANRVSEIQEAIPPSSWSHVPSEENPADCASRGVTPIQLNAHDIWWHGPRWLSQARSSWPLPPGSSTPTSGALAELRDTRVHTFKSHTQEFPGDLLERFSNLGKIVRIMAYILRFIENCRSNRSLRVIETTPNTSEYHRALQCCIRLVQKVHFTSERACLQGKVPISKKSSLIRLAPCIGEDKVIRVGGRLRNSTLTYDKAHPIILPKTERLTFLIIADAHIAVLHGGTQLTLSHLRQNYWILDGRNQVRNFIHKCIICFRYAAKRSTQFMADLPSSRVTPSRPFLHCGVDYAGPVSVRMSKGRGHRSCKTYICVFVCFTTRAVHLELVADLTSQAFIAAYQRFSARRGISAHVYSDQGTNFKGASVELRAMLRQAIQQNLGKIQEVLLSGGTQWHFNPPNAPHFGGIWEAAVKSTKHHLKRVLGQHKLTFEEMSTFLAMTEACLNSRPITSITNDPEDLTALTPGHFLVGGPLRSIPHPSLLASNERYLPRWKLVEKLRQDLWKRWSAEYLNTLQQRYKWQRPEIEVKIGDLALLSSNQLPPCSWALGRIIAIHPGADNHVRVVTVKCQTGTFVRPITKICVLPLDQGSEESA